MTDKEIKKRIEDNNKKIMSCIIETEILHKHITKLKNDNKRLLEQHTLKED